MSDYVWKVRVEGLVCRYGATTALSGVDLRVGPGKICALVGLNGAGKTTLLRTVVGLLRPASGRVTVLGRVPDVTNRQHCHNIGYVPSGTRSFYLRISGFENLLFYARLSGLRGRAATERARECLAAVGLQSAADAAVGTYSQGMQRRLAVARALLTRPPVLVLDEATHDLDPAGSAHVQQLVAERAAEGAAVLWTTQRLEEIRGFAQRVTVLNRGTVIFDGSVAHLAAAAPTQGFVVRLRNGVPDDELVGRLRDVLANRGTVEPTLEQEHFRLCLHDGVVLGEALSVFTAAGVRVLSCRDERSALEAALSWLAAGERESVAQSIG